MSPKGWQKKLTDKLAVIKAVVEWIWKGWNVHYREGRRRKKKKKGPWWWTGRGTAAGSADDRSKLPRDSFEKQCCGMQRGTCLPATRETIRGGPNRVYTGSYEKLQRCNNACSTRDRRVNTEGKVAVIFSSKSWAPILFAVHWVIPIVRRVHCTFSLSLSVCLSFSDSSKRSNTIERKADLVEIFFRRNRRFCWNSKSLKSVGESLFYNIFLEKKHCFFKCKKITFQDYTRMNHLFLLGFLSNRIFLREQLSRSKYEYSLRARENRVVES